MFYLGLITAAALVVACVLSDGAMLTLTVIGLTLLACEKD